MGVKDVELFEIVEIPEIVDVGACLFVLVDENGDLEQWLEVAGFNMIELKAQNRRGIV